MPELGVSPSKVKGYHAIRFLKGNVLFEVDYRDYFSILSMTTGFRDKTEYQPLTARPWLAPDSARPKIIAFIGSSDHTGTNLSISVASAVSKLDKRVRVLSVDGKSGYGDEMTVEEIVLTPADYLLVDLPCRLTPFTRSVLSCSDVVLVASSCKFDFLPETVNIIKVLLFLGLDMEKVAGVLVDPEGILSSALLAEIKPYLESSLGIGMAGVVSFGKGEGSHVETDIARLVQYIK